MQTDKLISLAEEWESLAKWKFQGAEKEKSGWLQMPLYYVIFSSTSRTSTQGLTPRISSLADEDIIDAAERELASEGRTLDDFAGARGLTPAQKLALSVTKLADNGRMFAIYTNPEGFIAAAEQYGLGEEARNFVGNRRWCWQF